MGFETTGKIFEAIEFGLAAHAGEVRKGTETPYITHPVGVSKLLFDLGCPEDCVIAGVLHDTVENTNATLEMIREKFGDNVAEIVQGCSEPDRNDTWENRKKQTIEYLKTASSEIAIVACADKLDNVESIIWDHKTDGENIWNRFNKGKEEQLWYYTALSEVFSSRELNFGYERNLFMAFKIAVYYLTKIIKNDKYLPVIGVNMTYEVEKFFNDSSIPEFGAPKFLIIMGGVGQGKTTVRKYKCAEEFVVIDAGEVFKNIGGSWYHEFGKDFVEAMDLIGKFVTFKAINERRNIVIEILGESQEEAENLIDSMKSCGYEIYLYHVSCDPKEAYKRSLNQNPNNIPAYLAQKYHQQWILDIAKQESSNKHLPINRIKSDLLDCE